MAIATLPAHSGIAIPRPTNRHGATTFPQAVVFTVTGVPAGATATLTPSTLPAGSKATDVKLSVVLPQQVAAVYPAPYSPVNPIAPPQPRFPALLFGILLLPIAELVRRWKPTRVRLAFASLLILAICFGFSGCGSKSSGYFTQQSQSFLLTITATSGGHSHSTDVTLVVK